MPRAAERAEALRLLSTALPDAERSDVLREALAAVREIRGEAAFAAELAPVPGDRADALVALAPQLPEPLLAEALAVALPEDPEQRAKALTQLAPHLPESLLPEALAAARTIEHWPFLRAPLAALAPRLPEHMRSEVIDEAMEAARERYSQELYFATRHYHTELEKAAVILDIASTHWRSPPRGYLAEGQERALENVRSESNEPHRAHELVELGPLLWGSGLVQALELALEFETEQDRSTALVGLIPYLPEPAAAGDARIRPTSTKK